MEEIDTELVADRLKKARLQKGVTGKVIERITGINDASIYGWERGESLPSAPNLFKLAKYYRVSTDYLLGLVDA